MPRPGAKGVLKGHLARANRQWRDFDPSVAALVVFQGAEAYITPSWYATKVETGKVVPTWNYAIVQAYRGASRHRGRRLAAPPGRCPDACARGDAAAALAGLGRARNPSSTAMLRGIVGIEIEIARIEGKWKVSQNRPEADRDGVVAGLRAEGSAGRQAMAGLVEAGGTKGGAR